MEIGESDALAGKAIEDRGAERRVPVAAEVLVSEVIGQNQDYVGLAGGVVGRAKGANRELCGQKGEEGF